MNIYSGIGRRQVGGGLWTTIQRGLSHLKPFARKIGETLVKKATGHAMNVGKNVLLGKDIKSAVVDEGKLIKSEAVEKLRGMKRKLLHDTQSGKGYKRRKISKPVKKRKMPKRKAKSGRKVHKRARVSRKKKRATSKRSTRKGRVTKKKKTSRRSKSVVRDIFSK